MRRLFAFAFLATLGGSLLASRTARATCCSSDRDCPRGFACSDGSCDPEFVDCKCDADCGPNLFCVPEVGTICVPTLTGQDDCHPKGQCAAAWQRPCATSADCGASGFTCTVNGQLCIGTDCRDTASCKPTDVPSTCATDGDCPAAWTCEPDTVMVAACVPFHQNCPASGCPVATDARHCRPPLFDLVGPSGFSGPPVVVAASCPITGGGGAGGGAGSSATTGSGGAGGSGSPAGGGAGHPGSAAPSGGCQLAPAGQIDLALLVVCSFALIGASLIRRRRISTRL